METEILRDSFVVVNTVRGLQIGKVLNPDAQNNNPNLELVGIERVATDEDLAIKEALGQKEAEAVQNVSEFLRHSRFHDVKIISAEYSLDSTRVTLFLNYDAETNFDIKGFLRETSHLFRSSRIEVRQVGPRDMAKMISGLGACGIEKRCCSRFLKDFSSISIKMAKAQDISLTPNEITGICGRLRCCLAYEYTTYEEALKNLPKKKKLIQTPLGEGKVSQVIPMADTVIVYIPELGNRKFTRDELESGVMAEKKPEAERFHVFEEHTNADVEILKLAPVPEQSRPARSEHRDSGGRNPRRDNARRDNTRPSQIGNTGVVAGDASAKQTGRSDRNQNKRRNWDNKRDKTPQPGGVNQASPSQTGRVSPQDNRSVVEKSAGQVEGLSSEPQVQKFRKPRREWIKKS
ncbi:MAG TPA: regulatory iron-sulfur-containing complex subunit RicT [Anaerolineaceae bacterium]|nr:regulatory iron-sulfur-containing complex subunit RicT [Anaerolineaceae bacterium]